MILSKYSFAINSYDQALETILICKKKNIFPIIFIKYFMINGLGPDWLKNLIELLENKILDKKFDIFTDCKKNYGLCISLIDLKIKYLKVEANRDMLNKLEQIANKNKVLLNPKLSVMDLTNIKNLDLKIKEAIS